MIARPHVRIDEGSTRTIVVGDIHGCFDELEQLLAEVEFSGADTLVAVGDLVDRGPRSWDVARFFRDTRNAHSVLGNHDRRLAGTIRGTSQPAWSQLQTLSLRHQDEWPGWADYFESLPAVIETRHAVIAHARLDPSRQLHQQEPFYTCAVGGPTVVIERDAGGVPTWFCEMRLEKPVCIGHVGYDRTELVEGRLYALDTGAVHGGVLTAVILPEGRLVSVPAVRDYYSEARNRWQGDESTGNRRIDEWKIAAGLPQRDIMEWPLRKVAEILRLEPPVENTVVAQAKQQLESAIVENEFEKLFEGARTTLRSRFGDVPETDSPRADYFQKLKTCIPGRQLGALAIRLLLGHQSAISVILDSAPRSTLREQRENVISLMKTLRGH